MFVNEAFISFLGPNIFCWIGADSIEEVQRGFKRRRKERFCFYIELELFYGIGANAIKEVVRDEEKLGWQKPMS